MEYLGKVVAPHGIKGEVKIITEFEYLEKAYVVGNKIIIDNKSYTIKTYRHHKIYDMVTLDDYRNINEIEFLIGKKVYIDKDELNLNSNEILDSEILDFSAIINDEKYKIVDVFDAGANNKIIRVAKDKEVLIPLKSPMVKKIDKTKKEIIIELIGGM